MATNTVNTNKCIDAYPIAASGSFTSNALNLDELKPNGYFSIQYLISGSGTCKFEYLCSNDGSNFVSPIGAVAIASGKTSSNNGELVSFTPPACKYLKIKCTETGGANTATVSVFLAIA